MDQSKIGAYIAVKRKAQDLTQAQLAQKLGVSDKSVSKWERGVCLPDVSLFSGHLRDSWNFHKRFFCRRGHCTGSGGRAIGKEYFSDSKGQRSQKQQAEEDHQVAGGGPGSRGSRRRRNHCKKSE